MKNNIKIVLLGLLTAAPLYIEAGRGSFGDSEDGDFDENGNGPTMELTPGDHDAQLYGSGDDGDSGNGSDDNGSMIDNAPTNGKTPVSAPRVVKGAGIGGFGVVVLGGDSGSVEQPVLPKVVPTPTSQADLQFQEDFVLDTLKSLFDVMDTASNNAREPGWLAKLKNLFRPASSTFVKNAQAIEDIVSDQLTAISSKKTDQLTVNDINKAQELLQVLDLVKGKIDAIKNPSDGSSGVYSDSISDASTKLSSARKSAVDSVITIKLKFNDQIIEPLFDVTNLSLKTAYQKMYDDIKEPIQWTYVVGSLEKSGRDKYVYLYRWALMSPENMAKIKRLRGYIDGIFNAFEGVDAGTVGVFKDRIGTGPEWQLQKSILNQLYDFKATSEKQNLTYAEKKKFLDNAYNIFTGRLSDESESAAPEPVAPVEKPAPAPVKLPSYLQPYVDQRQPGQTLSDQTLLDTDIIEDNSGTTEAGFAKMTPNGQKLLLDTEVGQLITFAKTTDPRYAGLRAYIKTFYSNWYTSALGSQDLALIKDSITPADNSLAQQGIAALKKELFGQLIEFKDMTMTQQRDPMLTNIFALKSPLWFMGN